MRDATPYEQPTAVWVEGGHVLVEGHDGTTLIMTPETALHLARLLGEAGSDSLINRITEEGAAGLLD